MKAAGSTASRDMRVLSPRVEPPDRGDDGSTASTATFEPDAVRSTPDWSMKVDFATPGAARLPTPLAPAPPTPRRRRAAPPPPPAPQAAAAPGNARPQGAAPVRPPPLPRQHP